jgi:hypothetical protein
LSRIPKLEDVMPGDAIVLGEGSRDGWADVNVEEQWVEHGAVDESSVTQNDEDFLSAEVRFYYKWAVYTTREVVRDKRREKLEEFIEEQFSKIDGWLNDAGGFADEKDCEAAHGALAEHVYPAYEALADRLSDPNAEDDVLSLPDLTLQYFSKTVNLDIAWLQEIEHDCNVGPGAVDKSPRFQVLEFFQRVYNGTKKSDEDEE